MERTFNNHKTQSTKLMKTLALLSESAFCAHCIDCIRALGSLGAKKYVSTTVRKVWEMHTENPQRVYHTKPHLILMSSWILNKVEKTDIEKGIYIPSLITAVLWHDAVYVPGNKDNEDLSAEMAIRDLEQMGVPTKEIARVSSNILDTKHMKEPDTEEGKCMVDADLASLALPLEDVWANTLDLWKESGKTSDVFVKCTSGFLSALLSRSSIFYSGFMKEEEPIAQENVTEIIRRLTAGELVERRLMVA